MNWKFWKPKPISLTVCQCGHERCFHTMGELGCWQRVAARVCKCSHYFPKHSQQDIEVEELRKLAGR